MTQTNELNLSQTPMVFGLKIDGDSIFGHSSSLPPGGQSSKVSRGVPLEATADLSGFLLTPSEIIFFPFITKLNSITLVIILKVMV